MAWRVVSNIMMSEEKDGEKERMQALIYWRDVCNDYI